MKIYALHGMLGSPTDWDAFESALGQRLEKIDLWREVRGWKSPTPLSLVSWAADFSAKADPNSILLGYSLGGRLALHALLSAPAKWRAAAVLSAHPGLESAAEKTMRSQADENWARRFASEPWADLLTAWNAQPVFSGAEMPRGAVDLEEFRQELATAMRAWSLGTQENLRPRLRQLTTPLLWLTGANDIKFSALAAEIAQAHFQIEAAGHRILEERPQQAGAAVKDFLTCCL